MFATDEVCHGIGPMCEVLFIFMHGEVGFPRKRKKKKKKQKKKTKRVQAGLPARDPNE